MAQRPQDDVKDVRVAAHSIVLPHGKFCISVAEVTPNVPPARLPGVSVTAIPRQGSTVAFARMAGEEWLREPGDAVLVAVSSQEARILLTSYNLSASTDVKPPRMHIQRLDSPPARQAAPPPAPIAQGPAKAGDVLVHVARRGDLQGAFGDWLGEQGDGLWIEGVQIEPPKGLPPEALEYQVVLGKGWTSPWSSGGEYCGSRGMTLPVQGIRVALRGEVADRFTVTCEARTVSGRELGPVSAGELCGLDDPESLAAIRLVIAPRAAAPASALRRQGRR